MDIIFRFAHFQFFAHQRLIGLDWFLQLSAKLQKNSSTFWCFYNNIEMTSPHILNITLLYRCHYLIYAQKRIDKLECFTSIYMPNGWKVFFSKLLNI